MRIISLAILILIGLTSCTRTVEVPENKVGIVYNYKTKDVVDRVFKSGKHSISMSSDIVLFDTTDQKLNFSFDILFKDATSAVIDFSIQYKLRVDSLPKVCEKYQAALEMPLEENVLLVTVRSQIRKQLLEVDKGGLSSDTIFDMIENNLKIQESITQMIEINSFSRGQISGL
jgi:hypothetical protein